MYLISLASSEDGMLVSTGELTLSFSGEVISWLSFGSAPEAPPDISSWHSLLKYGIVGYGQVVALNRL